MYPPTGAIIDPMTDNDGNITNQAKIDTEKEEARDQFLATLFLDSADKARFGRMKEELSNAYLAGRDKRQLSPNARRSVTCVDPLPRPSRTWPERTWEPR